MVERIILIQNKLINKLSMKVPFKFVFLSCFDSLMFGHGVLIAKKGSKTMLRTCKILWVNEKRLYSSVIVGNTVLQQKMNKIFPTILTKY